MKTRVSIGGIILFSIGYFFFDQYTGSLGFIKKDKELSNQLSFVSDKTAHEICDKMSSFSYTTTSDGSFIPFGRTYYLKSACYEEVARRTLDETWCSKVKRRWTLLNDGSRYTKQACLDNVARLKNIRQQQDKEFDQAEKLRQQFMNSAMKITKTWIDKLSDDQWTINVQVQGELPGNYKFEVTSVRDDKILVTENVMLDTGSKSLSWIIHKEDIVKPSDRLPNIFPIAVFVFYLPNNQITNIGNATISIP